MTSYNNNIDFASRFVSQWRDGEVPQAKPGNIVINHDTKFFAYNIAGDEYDEFIEWAAITWESDNKPREYFGEDMVSEPAQDYLERIDVSVHYPRS